MKPEINYTGEGRVDAVVARRLIEAAGATPGTAYLFRSRMRGVSALDLKIRGLNAGSIQGGPVLGLRDLDDDTRCAGHVVAQLVPIRSPRCLVRICVREVESWLIADRRAYAAFLHVPVANIPDRPDGLSNPKQVARDIASSGKSRRLARIFDEGRKRGEVEWQILGKLHGAFAEENWSPTRAVEHGHSPSLVRCFTALKALVQAS